MCSTRNPQSRVQHENLDVRSVGTTRYLRGVIVVGISRTASKGHFEFCMTLCTWQHERGALYIMIMTDPEDARRHPRSSNIAPAQAESRSCAARRAFPADLLRRGLHHHAPVSVWTKGRSISTGRFPVDASAERLFSFVFGCHHGQVNALPPIPRHLASFVVHYSVASLLDRSRWMIADVRCLLPRSSPVASR